MAPSTEDAEQVDIAARVVLGLLRLQSQEQGAFPLEDLPDFLSMAGDERERHGDFGAGRMLSKWADMLRDWE